MLGPHSRHRSDVMLLYPADSYEGKSCLSAGIYRQLYIIQSGNRGRLVLCLGRIDRSGPYIINNTLPVERHRSGQVFLVMGGQSDDHVIPHQLPDGCCRQVILSHMDAVCSDKHCQIYEIVHDKGCVVLCCEFTQQQAFFIHCPQCLLLFPILDKFYPGLQGSPDNCQISPTGRLSLVCDYINRTFLKPDHGLTASQNLLFHIILPQRDLQHRSPSSLLYRSPARSVLCSPLWL